MLLKLSCHISYDAKGMYSFLVLQQLGAGWLAGFSREGKKLFEYCFSFFNFTLHTASCSLV